MCGYKAEQLYGLYLFCNGYGVLQTRSRHTYTGEFICGRIHKHTATVTLPDGRQLHMHRYADTHTHTNTHAQGYTHIHGHAQLDGLTDVCRLLEENIHVCVQ